MPAESLIHPVILCGGAGTRLWPVSRQAHPKQFSRLLGVESPFQSTVRRLAGKGFAPPVIVTAAEFRFIVRDQLAAIGMAADAILIEPEPRNTAPAVLAATLWLMRKDPAALVLAAPSDHLMPDPASFRGAVFAGAGKAAEKAIVTFGIAPRHPETGYGYLELAGELQDGPVPLARFVEKPTAEKAAAMTANGRHLWNAGIFLFRADATAAQFEAHAPGVAGPVTRAVAGAERDLSFIRLAAGPWCEAQAISIDHGVMEKASNLWVIPYNGGWSDLGSWAAILEESEKDGAGVACSGDVTAISCRDSLLRSEEEGLSLVGIGLEGIVAIAMSDAVLIAKASEAQLVRDAVVQLKAREAKQATHFRRDHRPWGWYESLAMGPRFQVKRIVVHPGASLSLQSHHHRAEHWIVVEGTARVTIGETARLVSENQSVYIPLGEKHRLENPGRFPMVLIEVQTGAYLGEDDIIRYEDLYARDRGG